MNKQEVRERLNVIFQRFHFIVLALVEHFPHSQSLPIKLENDPRLTPSQSESLGCVLNSNTVNLHHPVNTTCNPVNEIDGEIAHSSVSDT